MFKPTEYVDLLLKTQGAGLSEDMQLVFKKLQHAHNLANASDQKLADARDTVRQLEQQLLQVQGRGAALTELLYENYCNNLDKTRGNAQGSTTEDLKAPANTN